MVVDLVVDVANVMGARPDGWWRDRAGAAERLVRALAPLVGSRVLGPEDAAVDLGSVVAVVEGRARGIPDVPAVAVVRAVTDGDTAVVDTTAALIGAGRHPLVVTADRGLRQRLAPGAAVAGPRWLLALL